MTKDLFKIQDIDATVNNICEFIKTEVLEEFQKKGVIIGLSGGIDSAVTAGLCAKSFESKQILGLIMPEKESDSSSELLGKKVAENYNFDTKIVDITKILESFGVYEIKENIVKEKFADFDENCKYRVVVPPKSKNSVGIPYLELLDQKNKIQKIKISSLEFLTLTAATSIKHRVRMTMLYFYAERNNFSVIGTTNKSEYQQGYFVKYGDGGSDIEPLVNLYKSQVYQLGEFLNTPKEIMSKEASPDVWSFPTSDEEFFYSVPYEIVDLILFSQEHKFSIEKIQEISQLSREEIENLIEFQKQKFRKSQHMREIPHGWLPNFS